MARDPAAQSSGGGKGSAAAPRVLVVAPEIASTGGTGRFLEALLDLHRRHGFDTAVLAPVHLCDEGTAPRMARHGARLLTAEWAGSGTTPFLTPWYDYRFLRPALNSFRPDLVVVSTAEPGRASVAFYFPVPVLYILHSIPESAFRLLPRLYLRLGVLLGNRALTVSAAAAAQMVRTMGIPPARLEVVHNAVPEVPRRSPSAEPVVLTAGHLVPYKNPHVWLETAERVLRRRGGVTFAWIGDGELLEPLRERVRGLGLADRILLPGHVHDPAPWYRRAQVYFQPSLRENHSIAVLEAMAHGVPCVAAATGGMPESVIEGETGYLCHPTDSGAFARRIEELLDAPPLRRALGDAGARRVTERFAPSQWEAKFLALYRRLLKEQGQ